MMLPVYSTTAQEAQTQGHKAWPYVSHIIWNPSLSVLFCAAIAISDFAGLARSAAPTDSWLAK